MKMAQRFLVAGIIGVFFGWSSLARATTKEELVAFVKKAIQEVKTKGKEAAFKKFNDHRDPDFHQGELYVYVWNYEGVCLAQGNFSSLIGTNGLKIQDPDGVYWLPEMLKISKEKKSGFFSYKFSNPAHNKKVEKKLSYLEDYNGEFMIGSGIYIEN